jgi:class 3 adenylate cyclase
MVGFTRLGEAVPPEDLVRLVERLGDLAREIVNPPVRSVKTIGDALMLICPDLVKLVDAMLELSEATGRDETLPQLRIGIASGWAVSRARDWFGSPVNVASHVTELRSPGRDTGGWICARRGRRRAGVRVVLCRRTPTRVTNINRPGISRGQVDPHIQRLRAVWLPGRFSPATRLARISATAMWATPR